jgi:hypothetical protein
MSKRISPVANLLVHEYGDEGVVLNLNTETYYSLNGVAVRMWQALTSSDTVEAAVTTLQAEFEVAEADLRRDVDEFIAQLHGMKLIDVTE